MKGEVGLGCEEHLCAKSRPTSPKGYLCLSFTGKGTQLSYSGSCCVATAEENSAMKMIVSPNGDFNGELTAKIYTFS